jgi:DNA-binding transcriptional MerR regulator
MLFGISHDTRNQVIREWLAGEARDKIASDTELAAGTVTNIVRDWRHKLGYPTADALRQLAIDLKRQGINTTDCARGFRTVNTIKKLGLVEADEEKGLESFVSDIYNKCKYYGLRPDKLINLAMQILDLLENIPLSQIPNYLEEKSKDKQKLEEEIKNLLERKSSAQLEYEEALQKKKVTIDMLQEFTHMQDTLIEYDLFTEDTPNLVNALKNAQQLGYDANAIADKISTIESLEEKEKILKMI